METTFRQDEAIKSVRVALGKAHRAGMVIRVYDGHVLLATKEHANDPRCDLMAGDSSRDMAEWIDECAWVNNGIKADGGAGV
ncbi:hypothetical protein [Pectobacterium carotovorum]|uniref:hypothetical protein n=1 Tax=Pectobacterium carotovorum TaxID=554 RepID=UPI000D73A59D|nr:hypothetical protein [Pectobacterium carotovorum]PXB01171.1 hypothetical protein DMB41_16380 [Pectobacterium carotovorum subsp. carotovorum]